MKMFYIMREAAKQKKLSYRQLANGIGVSKGTITRYMNGQIDLASELVFKLMLILGYDPYYQFFRNSVFEIEKPSSVFDMESRYARRTYKPKEEVVEPPAGSSQEG